VFSIIGAVAGFFLLGKNFIGGLLGFFVGSGIDNYLRSNQNVNSNSNRRAGNPYRSSERQSVFDIFEYYQQQTRQFDFPTSLLALSAYMMRSDGKVLKVELEFVKSFIKLQFGANNNQHHLSILKQFIEAPSIPIEQICQDIRLRMPEEGRVQLVHYLFGIAKADGEVSEKETQILQRLSMLLGVPNLDFNSVKGMYSTNVNADYEVLGITKESSDDEIKKAYRKLVVRYHPDKVQDLGEEAQKGAREKFQKVQESYERIKKNRSL
jgi:DnaJ like chaperone protein